MLFVLATPAASLITSFIASVPLGVCIFAHWVASAVSKVNEPEIVVVPVVAAPVVFDAVLVLLPAAVVVVAPAPAAVVVVAAPPLAAVVVVALSAAEPTTHSVSNNWS